MKLVTWVRTYYLHGRPPEPDARQALIQSSSSTDRTAAIAVFIRHRAGFGAFVVAMLEAAAVGALALLPPLAIAVVGVLVGTPGTFGRVLLGAAIALAGSLLLNGVVRMRPWREPLIRRAAELGRY